MLSALNGRTPGHVLMTADAVGGVWQYSLELARGFAARGIEITLAVLGPVPNGLQLAEASAIPALRVVPTQLPLDWTATVPESLHAAAQSLVELAAQCKADSIHLHTPALVGETSWPVPVLAVAHSCVATWWHAVRGGAMPRDFAWRANCVADGLARADAVIAPIRSFAAMLQRVYHVGRAIAVVHNGRRPPLPAAKRDRRRAVLTAGRLWDEGKNIAVLDRAAARLDAPVYAAGPLSGPHGVTIGLPHLHTLGPLDAPRLAAEYTSIPLFASPSRYEPFGLAALEAAQAGMALVLSDIPTFHELWDDAAWFVDPLDADAWAAALQVLLDNEEETERLAAAAQSYARKCGADAMVDRTIAVHDVALAAPELVQ